jgi:hypothetical protein
MYVSDSLLGGKLPGHSPPGVTGRVNPQPVLQAAKVSLTNVGEQLS